MKKDHYSTLGVTPASEDVVIRAAYRALMRRYHPDADPGADAAEKAREINEAYRVLSDPQRRSRYDEDLAASSLLKFDPQPHVDGDGGRTSRIAPVAALCVAAAAAGMIAFAVSPSVRDFVVPPPDARPTLSAKPAAAVSTEAPALKPLADSCADPSAERLIKQELFRQATARRPADREQIEQIASLAHIRLETRKDRRAGGSGCSGWLAIDLPRGLVVDGGRTNLNADIGFQLERDGRRMRLASLSGTNSLVGSLATFGPEPKVPPPDEVLDTKQVAAAHPVPVAKPAKPVVRAAAKPSAPVETAQANDLCGGASSRLEKIVCANSNLSSLDRQLALLYRQSWKQADEKKKAALVGTRQRFNERRDACGSPNCMTTAYVSRLREISDIMAGKVQQ